MDEEKKIQPILSGKEISATVAAAGAAASQALTVSPAAPPTALAMAAVLVAIFPPIVAAISEVGIRRMRARADRFFASIVEKWARDANVTAEEVAGVLEAHKEDPNVADAIWRAVRALMDAPNDAAAVPLGVLAAEYARDKRAADPFFRGTTRLLTELSGREVEELHKVLVWVLQKSQGDRVDVIARDVETTSSDRTAWKSIPWKVSLRDAGGSSKSEIDYPGHPIEAGRLLSLLKANGLANESALSFYDYNPPTAELRRDMVEHLARVLGAG